MCSQCLLLACVSCIYAVSWCSQRLLLVPTCDSALTTFDRASMHDCLVWHMLDPRLRIRCHLCPSHIDGDCSGGHLCHAGAFVLTARGCESVARSSASRFLRPLQAHRLRGFSGQLVRHVGLAVELVPATRFLRPVRTLRLRGFSGRSVRFGFEDSQAVAFNGFGPSVREACLRCLATSRTRRTQMYLTMVAL